MFSVGSLFAGIGGIDPGLHWAGFRTIWAVEKNKKCQKLLRRKFPNARIYSDVNQKEVFEEESPGVICGGYPCQPFSIAGDRRGTEDDRWLWPAMFALVQKHRPYWVVGENVVGHITMGLDIVLSDLESAAYTARTFVIPAASQEMPHLRERVFVVAHAPSSRWEELHITPRMCKKQSYRMRSPASAWIRQPCPEPAIRRMDDGLSKRLDASWRSTRVGNAVAPAVAYQIGVAIAKATQKFLMDLL